MGSRTQQPEFEGLRARFRAAHQAHVFDFWPGLDAEGRARLLAQASALAPQLDELTTALSSSLSTAEAKAQAQYEPAPAVLLPENGGSAEQLERARELGRSILADGRVAAFVVAGGQGTRLRFAGPNGAYALGPVSGRTLFELQAQKIRGLTRRLGRSVPWYVMTSDATHAETLALFEGSNYFEVPREDVRIFQQQMVPAFDFEGRMMLERPDRIFESPNGHGGSLTALAASGALDDMREREIDTLFYYQVDNPLVKIADPVFLGLHHEARADVSCKAIRKRDPEEKVGVLVQVGGHICVVEYTELRDEHRYARDPSGRLEFWAGNSGIHLFSLDFVAKVSAQASALLPFHVSAKKVPTVDSSGKTVAPSEPNGYKLERFVFDALPAARSVCIQEVAAADNFSPIKNAVGVDCPETARRDLMALYRRWLEPTDIRLPPEDQPIEIDHSVIDGPEDALAAGFRSLTDAGDVIRVGARTQP